MKETDFKLLVIEKAKKIFVKYGYSKTTMNDIAKACYKSKGLIYHHYKSKEEIFRKIVFNEIYELISKIKNKINTSLNPEEKFIIFATNFISDITNTTNLYNKIIFDINEFYIHIEDIIKKLVSSTNDILMNIIKEGKEQNYFNVIDEEEAIKTILIIFFAYVNPILSETSIQIIGKPKIETIIQSILKGILK